MIIPLMLTISIQFSYFIKNRVQSYTSLFLTTKQFVYNQSKGKAIYVILFEYFKKHIMGTSCAGVISILKKSRKQEVEEDTTIKDMQIFDCNQMNIYTKKFTNQKRDIIIQLLMKGESIFVIKVIN
ncbi:hypothetical protein RFI_30749 [Reticulomyxa filosa]|uniref:Uncharacterized protein n=1 Tax=Reticulomyxa filosa TaxID=46433 RepID=X6LXG6_RETFI|nr:hypothetical protein RFI_30749 [Reticulomyxa filosa]|eukprot:ETO06643.1 hypothetical protein RFI_30749 [Reticulomyxa filosa]